MRRLSREGWDRWDEWDLWDSWVPWVASVPSFPRAFCFALLVATGALAQAGAPANELRLGAYFVHDDVKANDLSGPFTPPGINIRVGDVTTPYIGYIRNLDPHWALDLAAGVPPTVKTYGKGPATVGSVPFNGDTPVEIAMKHLSAIPEPPSAKRSEVPRDLDLIVMRALAKDPRERYASCQFSPGKMCATLNTPPSAMISAPRRPLSTRFTCQSSDVSS